LVLPQKTRRNQNNNKIQEAQQTKQKSRVHGGVGEEFTRAWKTFAHLPVGSQVDAGIFNQTRSATMQHGHGRTCNTRHNAWDLFNIFHNNYIF